MHVDTSLPSPATARCPQVRDRRVTLSRDAERGVVVKVASAAAPATGAHPRAPAVQLMLSFSMADWEAMCGALPEGSCLMKHRASVDHGSSAAAGTQQQRRRQRQQDVEEEEDQEEEGEEEDKDDQAAAARGTKRARRRS